MRYADVTIIGAGIAGLSVARELSRYRLRVAVIEKESDVAVGSTRASSSIVHADYGVPGSATARLTVQGNRLFDDLCHDLGVAFKRCGELFVAFPGEEGVLEEIARDSRANGAVPFRELTREEVLRLEPRLNPELVAGLLGPSGGVVTSFELAIALYENARANGVEFFFGSSPTQATTRDDGDVVLRVNDTWELQSRFVVNAAGLFADEVAALLGDEAHIRIRPERGQEVILDKCAGGLVSRVVFDCGTGLVVPTTHGNIMLGTTREETSSKRSDRFTTAQGVESIISKARRLVPGIDAATVIRCFAGLRVLNDGNDHFIGRSEGCNRLVTVSLQTGGVTAGPAAAIEAIGLLEESGLALERKPDFSRHRRPAPVFRDMSPGEQAEMIRQDPRYGRVVCRCETVTEGEVVEAIRRGARTVDGVKYRVRAGMGRCQGGFCGPRVMAILTREIGMPLEDVRKTGLGSWMVTPRDPEEPLRRMATLIERARH